MGLLFPSLWCGTAWHALTLMFSECPALQPPGRGLLCVAIPLTGTFWKVTHVAVDALGVWNF